MVQGDSNMTGTDLCVNWTLIVPVIFEPPCILRQLLCFWTLSIVLFLCKTCNVSETGFCLRLQVGPTKLGPVSQSRTGMGLLCRLFSGTIQQSAFRLLPKERDRIQRFKHTPEG
jgi:hypothetical protein